MSLSFGVNQALVEDQLRRYLSNPKSVDDSWRDFFDNLADEDRAHLFPPVAAAPATAVGTNGRAARAGRPTAAALDVVSSQSRSAASIDRLSWSDGL